jgi:hypothetical protein
MNVEQETLGFRRAGFSPALTLLMSAFALLIPPAVLSNRLRRRTERSPTTQPQLSDHIRSFGYRLSPVTSSAQEDSISELLRFL